MIINTNNSIAGLYLKDYSKDKTLGEDFSKTMASYDISGYKSSGKGGNIQIDYNEKAFDSLGANAPEEVKKAWMEAAREAGANGLGMLQNGKISHISQMMVQKAVNWYHGEPGFNDILGSTVQSAMDAARQALFELENPLLPHSPRKIEVQQQIIKEKDFYRIFIEKLEKL